MSVKASISVPTVNASITTTDATPFTQPRGRGTAVVPAPAGSGAGLCLYGQGTGRIPVPVGSGAGVLTLTGSGVGKMPVPVGSGQGLLDQLVTDFVNAGLAVVEDYDTRHKVRANASSLACAFDDSRAAADVGAASFAGNVAATALTFGSYPGLDHVTKATFSFDSVLFDDSTTDRTIIGRWGNSAAKRQFYIHKHVALGLWFSLGDATTTYDWRANLIPAFGTRYRGTFLYDGTQASDLAKVVLVYQSYDPTTNTWSAETTDVGSAVTAGFPAQIQAGGTTGNTVGGDVSSGTGAHPWHGLMADLKIFPNALLTTAQRAAAWTDNPAAANWVIPDVWFPFTDFANHGAAGAAYNLVVNGDILLCTDDPTVGCTLVSGSTNAPSYIVDASGARLVGDGVSQFMQAVGGQLTRIGATDDYALVLIGQEPSVPSGRWATTGTLSGTTSLHAALNAGGQLEGESGTRIADLARAAGIRVVVVRRRANGTDVGLQDGNGAEQLGTSGVASASAPVQLNIFASLAGGNFGDATLRRLTVVKGNMSTLQFIATRWGATFVGATV